MKKKVRTLTKKKFDRIVKLAQGDWDFFIYMVDTYFGKYKK